MNRPIVIRRSQLPTKFPFQLTALVYLLIEHFNTNDFWRGVIWVLVVLLWITSIVVFIAEVDKPVLFIHQLQQVLNESNKNSKEVQTGSDASRSPRSPISTSTSP